MTENQVSGSRIVSPQEAQAALGSEDIDLAAYNLGETRLLHTVATEPDRTRAAVVAALRDLPDHIKPNMSLVAQIEVRADAIEAGADW